MTTDTQLNYEVDDIDDPTLEADDDAYAVYRSVSKAAVASVLLLFLGLSGLTFPVLLALPAIGFLLGILAWRNLRRFPDELTGRFPATLGLVGCLILVIGGSAWHTYVYMTEVPAGYKRITFADLQPRENPRAETGELPLELNGQRVFVKGYVHPGVASTGQLKKFILVPDMGTCCFGGQPKLTDMIEVTIVDVPGVRYTQRKRKLAGTLHVALRVHKVAGGLDGGYYELDADYVK
ncbi:MAG: DUF3299 domain-containing protein [Pirellulaceae bacterium]